MSYSEFQLKILPLYLLIVMGFFVGRRTKIKAADLAAVNLNFIAPLIFFGAISRQNLTWESIILPVAAFLLMSAMAVLVFVITKIVSKDGKKPYWFAATCANSNLGYFGIPVFVMLFGEKDLGLYMLYLVGGVVFFYTVINYLILRGHYSMKEAFQKITRLPVFYAMILGFLFQAFGLHVPREFDASLDMMRGAYSVLGMMVIGIVLGAQTEDKKGVKWDLAVFSNAMRFAVYPAIALAMIWADSRTFGLLSPVARNILVVASLMPLGADTTSLAAHWNMRPERIAMLTILNTTLALFLIPVLLPFVLALL